MATEAVMKPKRFEVKNSHDELGKSVSITHLKADGGRCTHHYSVSEALDLSFALVATLKEATKDG
jgi:hypothetical protein